MINNFVINTASFLNTFTESIENKLSTTATKLTQLEILLSVLEAKLNSVPGLESISPVRSSSHTTAESSNSNNNNNSPPDVSQQATSEVLAQTTTGTLPEEYQPFLKMIKVGIPKFVAQAKAAAAGLDPALLEDYTP